MQNKKITLIFGNHRSQEYIYDFMLALKQFFLGQGFSVTSSKNLRANTTNVIIEEFCEDPFFIEKMEKFKLQKKGKIVVVVTECLTGNYLNSFSFNEMNLVDTEGYGYPVTEDVVVTSVQQLEGTFMDVMFVTANDFDFNKFKFIEKEIQNEKEETIIGSLISEVYYDGEFISFEGSNTDLRMAKIYFDQGEKKKVEKNEKNINRRI